MSTTIVHSPDRTRVPVDPAADMLRALLADIQPRDVNDLLDISKIEAGREQLNPVEFNLHSTIQGLGTMFEIRCQPTPLQHLR